jgi:hypothetical protein
MNGELLDARRQIVSGHEFPKALVESARRR